MCGGEASSFKSYTIVIKDVGEKDDALKVAKAISNLAGFDVSVVEAANVDMIDEDIVVSAE
jgi:hypothetical protein